MKPENPLATVRAVTVVALVLVLAQCTVTILVANAGAQGRHERTRTDFWKLMVSETIADRDIQSRPYPYNTTNRNRSNRSVHGHRHDRAFFLDLCEDDYVYRRDSALRDWRNGGIP